MKVANNGSFRGKKTSGIFHTTILNQKRKSETKVIDVFLIIL